MCNITLALCVIFGISFVDHVAKTGLIVKGKLNANTSKCGSLRTAT